MLAGSTPKMMRLCRLLAALAVLGLVAGGRPGAHGRSRPHRHRGRAHGEELKKLTEDLEKDQPLTGDSLALLQGAQARRATHHTARCARAATTTRAWHRHGRQPAGRRGRRPRRHRRAARHRQDRLRVQCRHRPASIKSVDLAIQGPPDIVGYPGLDRSKLGLGAGQAGRRGGDPERPRTSPRPEFREHGYALAGGRAARSPDRPRHARGARSPSPSSRDRIAAWGRCASRAPRRSTRPTCSAACRSRKASSTTPAKVERAARQADLARRVQLGAHQAGEGARRQRRAADRRRAHRPAAAHHRLRHRATRRSSASPSTASGCIATCSARPRACGSRPRSTTSARATYPRTLGFGFKADFRKPDWWLPGQDGRATAEVAARSAARLQPQGRRAFRRPRPHHLDPHLAGAGRAYRAKPRRSRAPACPSGRTIELLGVPMSVLMNKANSDVDPTTGYRLQLDVTPYADFGPNNDFFSIIRLTGRSYFDLASPAAACWRCAPRSAPSPPPTRRHPAGQAVLCRRRRLGARLRLPERGPARRLQQSAGRRQRRRGERRIPPALRQIVRCRGVRRCRQRLSRHAAQFLAVRAASRRRRRRALLHRFRPGAARCRLSAQRAATATRRSASMSASGRPSDALAPHPRLVFGGLVVLGAGVLFAGLQTPPGQRALAGLVSTNAQVSGLSGFFPTDLRVAHRAPRRAGRVAHVERCAAALVVRLAVQRPRPGREAVGARRSMSCARRSRQTRSRRPPPPPASTCRSASISAAVGRRPASRRGAGRRRLALEACRRGLLSADGTRSRLKLDDDPHRRTVGQARGRYRLRPRSLLGRRPDHGGGSDQGGVVAALIGRPDLDRMSLQAGRQGRSPRRQRPTSPPRQAMPSPRPATRVGSARARATAISTPPQRRRAGPAGQPDRPAAARAGHLERRGDGRRCRPASS